MLAEPFVAGTESAFQGSLTKMGSSATVVSSRDGSIVYRVVGEETDLQLLAGKVESLSQAEGDALGIPQGSRVEILASQTVITFMLERDIDSLRRRLCLGRVDILPDQDTYLRQVLLENARERVYLESIEDDLSRLVEPGEWIVRETSSAMLID